MTTSSAKSHLQQLLTLLVLSVPVAILFVAVDLAVTDLWVTILAWMQ
jgi:hypothetical protein